MRGWRAAAGVWLAAIGLAAAEEPVDLRAVHRIKDEAFTRSAVMDHLFDLSDANGPRLTLSSGHRRAAEWSVGRLKAWGIGAARLEAWGTLGPGWELLRFEAHLKTPAYAPLRGWPKAWSAGTAGTVTAEVVYAPLFEDSRHAQAWDLQALRAAVAGYAASRRGTLEGRIVLLDPPRSFALPLRPAGERYDRAGLDTIARAPEPRPDPPLVWPLTRLPDDEEERWRITASLPTEIGVDFYERRRRVIDDLNAFLKGEGVAAVLTTDGRGDGGLIFVEGASSRLAGSSPAPPTIVLAPEEYARVARLARRGVPATIELRVDARLTDGEPEGVNVIAEIPGGAKRDEVVMIGAHLDSWHAATGATDNAAGCAVVLEAMRILKTLDLRMARTVRLALWDGEEMYLMGSRAWVRRHLADPVSMALRPEHARLSAYFNVDNGAGKFRGVYLQGNDMVRPIFAAWLGPFRDLGAETLTLEDTGATDHKPFDSVGVPAFQFLQDPLDYLSRTHHSDLDLSDHVVAGDLMQSAAILASFVYHAANRAEMLPRKPLPAPLPPQRLDPMPEVSR